MTAHDTKDRYAVIGHPVGHSLSPMIHAQFAEQTDQALVYEAIDVPGGTLTDALHDLGANGLRGMNVTTPHKQAVLSACETLSPRATLASSVNTLSRRDGAWHGDTTDGAGFVADLREHLNVDIEGRQVLLVGAGGSARSLLGALLEQKPAGITIANRTYATAQHLVRHYAELGEVRASGLERVPRRAYFLVINATSATLNNVRPAVPPGVVRGSHCYDLVYRPGGTMFTDWCLAHGARAAYTGIGMLVEQAALSFEIWRGERPDTGPIRRRLADELDFRFGSVAD